MNTKKSKHIRAKNFHTLKLSATMWWCSFLILTAGFFCTNHSLEFESLLYAIKQIFLPSGLFWGIGLLVGRCLDYTQNLE